MHRFVSREWERWQNEQGWVSMATVLGLNCNAHLVQFFFLSPPFSLFVTVNKRSSVNS